MAKKLRQNCKPFFIEFFRFFLHKKIKKRKFFVYAQVVLRFYYKEKRCFGDLKTKFVGPKGELWKTATKLAYYWPTRCGKKWEFLLKKEKIKKILFSWNRQSEVTNFLIFHFFESQESKWHVDGHIMIHTRPTLDSSKLM